MRLATKMWPTRMQTFTFTHPTEVLNHPVTQAALFCLPELGQWGLGRCVEPGKLSSVSTGQGSGRVCVDVPDNRTEPQCGLRVPHTRDKGPGDAQTRKLKRTQAKTLSLAKPQTVLHSAPKIMWAWLIAFSFLPCLLSFSKMQDGWEWLLHWKN